MSGILSQLRNVRGMLVLLALETAIMVPFAMVEPLAWLLLLGLILPTWILAFAEAHRLAKRLAMVLGSGWTYETPKVQDGDRSPRYASLRHTEGYGMHLAPIWNKPD